jgi:hypothetical protein
MRSRTPRARGLSELLDLHNLPGQVDASKKQTQLGIVARGR